MNVMKCGVFAFYFIYGAIPSLNAQQYEYKFDVGQETKLDIPANSISDNTLPEEVDVSLETVNGVWVKTVNGEPQPLDSCLDYIREGLGIGNDGVYATTLSGGTNVRCDMKTDGGGWTLVVAQYENDPVEWLGDMAFYDPFLSAGRGFALPNLPAHTETGFGQLALSGLMPSFWINAGYSTGNIPVQQVTDQQGNPYHYHRSATGYYNFHDPDRAIYYSTANQWADTLILDYVSSEEIGREAHWVFAKNHTSVSTRGFAYKGFRADVSDTAPWLIFVR